MTTAEIEAIAEDFEDACIAADEAADLAFHKGW